MFLNLLCCNAEEKIRVNADEYMEIMAAFRVHCVTVLSAIMLSYINSFPDGSYPFYEQNRLALIRVK